MNFFIITMLCFIGAVVATTTSEKKVLRRPTQKAVNIVSGKTSIQQSTKSSNSNNKSNNLRPSLNKSSQSSVSRSSNNDPFKKFQNVVVAVKDEIVDCVDSLVFAENNTERLDNLFEIAYRHRPILAGGAMILVGKIAFSKSQAVSAADRLRQELRMAEITKWGKRLGK